jgi:acyl-CoA synthetase (AMP-forming)/AMP-acid ligase II
VTLRDFSFLDVYRRNAQLFPNRTAFVFEGDRVTHRDYLARVERLAAGLAREGVGPGDRAAILSHNSLEMVDLIGAVATLGAILLPVNFRLSAEEISFVLADGAPKLVIAGPEYQKTIAGLADKLTFAPRLFAIGLMPRPLHHLPTSSAATRRCLSATSILTTDSSSFTPRRSAENRGERCCRRAAF